MTSVELDSMLVLTNYLVLPGVLLLQLLLQIVRHMSPQLLVARALPIKYLLLTKKLVLLRLLSQIVILPMIWELSASFVMLDTRKHPVVLLIVLYVKLINLVPLLLALQLVLIIPIPEEV